MTTELNGTRPLIARALAALVLVGLVPLFSSSAWAQAGTMQTIRYGKIVSMNETVVEVQGSTTGTTVGATAGAVAGYALAGGRDRWLGGLLGGVVGGAAGRAADRAAKKKKGWELIIKLEDAEEIAISVPGKKKRYATGDRVRLTTAPNGQTQVTRVEG
jgi:outer membrane lipoprotein SlyB